MAQLLSTLDIGAKIKLGKHQVGSETAQPIIWIIADKNHKGYPNNSITLITQKIIDLRAYDSYYGDYEEASDYEIDYRYSDINQWLNSNAPAGKWWVSKYTGATSPTSQSTAYSTYYGSRAGFLYNFTNAEINALLPTTFNAQWGSETASMTAKVYLPSITEMIDKASADGSSQFTYFKTNTARSTLTSQAFNNTNVSSSVKPSSTSAYCDYHCRNTFASPKTVRGINIYSEQGSWNPNDGSKGIRPVINISANTKITDATDSDGCYIFLAQTAPTIDGTNKDLGSKSAGFSQTYVVNDADQEAVTVKEYLDNTLIRSHVPTRGATNTISITGATWLKLANGIHTIKIVATDGFDEVTRTYTFTKNVTGLEVVKKIPYDSSTMPTQIRVSVVRNIPTGATFKVEVCNNGYDESPIWEDITAYVISGDIYDFKNTTRIATKWGVNVKVTVERNDASGACYITEIGGNFE